MRRLINWVGLFAVGAAAAIMTFNTLRALAESCGFHGWESALLPVAVDAAGAVATNVWLTGRDSPEAVRFARRWALTAAGVSLLGNAAQHALTEYKLPVPWWLVVLVAVVGPLALVGTVHLMVLLSKGADHPAAPGPVLTESPAVLPAAPPTAPTRPKRPATRPPTRERHSAPPDPTQVRALAESGMGRRAISKETGLSEHAVRLALAARNGSEPPALTH